MLILPNDQEEVKSTHKEEPNQAADQRVEQSSLINNSANSHDAKRIFRSGRLSSTKDAASIDSVRISSTAKVSYSGSVENELQPDKAQEAAKPSGDHSLGAIKEESSDKEAANHS